MTAARLIPDLVDAHFHIWDKTSLPWLNGPIVPRIFGPYKTIQRDYLIDEYLADARPSGLTKAVYVQANWARAAFEDEVRFVERQAAEAGFPIAVVAYADFTVDDVRPQLERIARHACVRGVRMQLHWHQTAEYRFAPSATQVSDPVVRRNVGYLKEFGLSFELQVFAGQMPAGAELVADNPNTTFILTHCGMLVDRSTAELDLWQAGLAELARHENCYAKLSGLGTFARQNDPPLITFIVDRAISIFGSDRLMFGSNFPVEKIWTNYADIVRSFDIALEAHDSHVRAAIFGRTARAVYNL
jgi:L-fuconolactonase